ncbi:MAG: hypothetical protein GX213_08635 [Clostridiaceae bacterium]|nr:hypothetical protein [Clostridiaceae bacterium]
MKRYYKFIVESADRKIDYFTDNQVMNEDRPDYGSIKSAFIDVKMTVYIACTGVAAYLNPKSKHYNNELLLKRLSAAYDFVRRYQREDGSFDLASCNFKSAPDTAFIIKRLTYTYNLIKKYDKQKNLTEIKNKLYNIIYSAANALITGGFHTPNHRWAIAAGLAACSNIIEDGNIAQRCINRMNEYFVEPVDCTDDGEYSERSSGNYNAVVNTAMIMLCEELNDKRFLEYVERNLNMMLLMFDADGSIFTENSLRQDKGKKEYPTKYFYQFLYMSQKSKNCADKFNAAAHKIIADAVENRDYSIDCLHLLMLYDWMADIELNKMEFPTEYSKYFPYSGLVRVRKQNITYSLIEKEKNFLFFQNNATRLGMKIGVSYFQHRNFIAEKIEHKENTYIMKFKADGWYYMPFKEKPETSDWWQMDNESRELYINSFTEIVVEVTDIPNGIEVRIKTNGIDRIPVRVEISLPVGGKLYSENFITETTGNGQMILKDGEVLFTKDNDELIISGGFASHEFIRGGYSEDSANDMSYILYMTDYTNFDHAITIKVK